MRTLFVHRGWRGRFASSGRFRLRTFAERSVEHLKHWAVVYAAMAAIALWFHAHYGFGLNASPTISACVLAVASPALATFCPASDVMRERFEPSAMSCPAAALIAERFCPALVPLIAPHSAPL